MHFEEPKPALEFEIDSDDSESGFMFEDITTELQYYEKQEMSSFQKVNMFFNQITNPQLHNYIAGTDETYKLPEQSSEHRFFC